MFAQTMTAQANMDVMNPVSPNMGTRAYSVSDFSMINHLEFDFSKVGGDHQKFIHEVYKILAIMALNSAKKTKLATYELEHIAQI